MWLSASQQRGNYNYLLHYHMKDFTSIVIDHDIGLPISMENIQVDSQEESKRRVVLPLCFSGTFISCKALFLIWQVSNVSQKLTII
jgi:hypothetical protein